VSFTSGSIEIRPAPELARYLVAELTRAWNTVLIDSVVSLQVHGSWLLGTPLELSTCVDDWENVIDSFDAVAKRTNVVHRYWQLDNTILVKARYDAFASARSDYGLQSKAWTPLNNVPIYSTKRV